MGNPRKNFDESKQAKKFLKQVVLIMLVLDKNRTLSKIHPITQQTLDIFVQKVLEQEGENLKKIVLFGSVAREEADKDSDIDVLVILKEMSSHNFRLVSDISADVSWDMDYDENSYIQPVTVSEEETHGLAYWGLMKNISKEGVVLYDIGE